MFNYKPEPCRVSWTHDGFDVTWLNDGKQVFYGYENNGQKRPHYVEDGNRRYQARTWLKQGELFFETKNGTTALPYDKFFR